MKNRICNVVLAFLIFSIFNSAGLVDAAEPTLKIGVIDVQRILTESQSGQEVRKALEAEAAKFQSELRTKDEALKVLEDEIKKKSSIWSVEIRAEKENDYKKKRRELQVMETEANEDFQLLQKKLTEPVIKDLNEVITELAKSKGYTMIMEFSDNTPIRPPLLYVDDSLDISDLVIKELDARRAKK